MTESGPGPKRVLMLSEYFHPHWTGLAKSFLNLARDLQRAGHSVTVLTSRYAQNLLEEEEFQGLRILRAPCLFYVSRTNYSLRLLTDSFRLMKNCDVVIINSPFSNVLFAAIAAKLRGKKCIIYHQGDLRLPKQSGSRFSNFIVERIFDLFTLPAMALSDKIVTYTRDYAEHSRVMKHFLAKFQAVIPHIAKPQAGSSSAVNERLKVLKQKGPLIGFAGRFVEEKGFDILLKAIPWVLAKHPQANFVFAGETNVYYERFFEHTAGLFEKVKGNVHLLGLLQSEDLGHFYHALDLFVLCSRSDCFALTQVEAALCGVPLVVSDIPGARAFVAGTGAGVLTKAEDPQALADGILKILQAGDSFIPDQARVTEYLKTYEKLDLN